jgi:hypothetical protein
MSGRTESRLLELLPVETTHRDRVGSKRSEIGSDGGTEGTQLSSEASDPPARAI